MHGSCAYKYRVVGTVDTAGRKTLLLICCKRANARGRTERFIHLHREYPTPSLPANRLVGPPGVISALVRCSEHV